jgi:hypothetical protein
MDSLKINVFPILKEFSGEYAEFCVRPATLPKWLKESSNYAGDPRDKGQLRHRMTVKKCIPVFDVFTTGVHLHLPAPMIFEGKYPNRTIDYPPQIPGSKLSGHDLKQKQKMPIDSDWEDNIYKLEFPYYIQSPKGYSTLYVPAHPYEDFPLHFISAIVQTDKYKNSVNFPFFASKSFTGEVDAGTHFMSIFFVKRHDVKINYKTYEEGIQETSVISSMVSNWGKGFYKKLSRDQI